MPVSKNKPTTMSPEGSTSESASNIIPEQEEFRQYLRRLAVSAVQVLIEHVMREELEQCIGASWGECTPTRRGYRNGSYTRDLVTPTGRIEDLKVRRRSGRGVSHPGVRTLQPLRTGGSRSTDADVCEWGKHPQSGGGRSNPHGSCAQRQCGEPSQPHLDRAICSLERAWPSTPLPRGVRRTRVHFTVRHGEKSDATIILTALGVDLEGSREVLALRACAEESKDGWTCLLQDLRTRGVTEIDLVVSDGHDGLLAAVGSLFTATLRQRCLVHKQRNVMNAIPHREQKEVGT